MGQLIVTEFATLDGVAQAPGAPDEDRDAGFAHGGWQAPYIDEAGVDDVFAAARTMDALLLGRRTYEIFADYWPTAPADMPFTTLLDEVPRYVASRTLSAPLRWDGTNLLEGDLAESVPALTERYGEVHVIGSLDLVQSLLRLGLVDDFRFVVHPVVAGHGPYLFPGLQGSVQLELVAAGLRPMEALRDQRLRTVDADVPEARRDLGERAVDRVARDDRRRAHERVPRADGAVCGARECDHRQRRALWCDRWRAIRCRVGRRAVRGP